MDNITTSQSKTVKIHAPEWFAQPDFQAWFNNNLGCGLATWQNVARPLNGTPNDGDYTDCFITVEPQSAEGSDSDLPQAYWDIVVREAHKVADGREDCQIVVWISPL